MEKKILRRILNRIAVKRFVNLHCNGSFPDDDTISDILNSVGEKRDISYLIKVDIKEIPKADVRAAHFLTKIINKELSQKRFKHKIAKSNAIDLVLDQLNEKLDQPGLIIFYPFTNPDKIEKEELKKYSKKNNEKEKAILTFIRKFIEMKRSLLLGILLISNHPVGEWDLGKYSDFDERNIDHVPYSIQNQPGDK